MRTCLNCQKTYESRDNRRKYCSCSCSTAMNNHLKPKIKKLERKCACGVDLIKRYAKKCRKCYYKNMIDRMGRIPVEIAKTNRGPSINAYTRQHSKSIMNFYNIPKICVVCGYSKYVEICHIDPISGFSGETPLEIVNALSNLVHLCPNHHKEFDRNLISQDEKEIIVKGSKHLYNIEV